jgi:hypothetical protein
MSAHTAPNEPWPALPLEAWRETYDTLHMWMQVIGKLTLVMSPLTNHWWNVTLHATSRGLVTQPLSLGGPALTATFDFISHQLVLACSDGVSESIPLRPRTVADFYAEVMKALKRLGVDVRIWTMPVEFPDPVRFEADTIHKSYDPAWASAFWRAMLSMWPVFEQFRSRFVGKCSPVHFFWGSFDLAVTRFSGRRAPDRPGADAMTREAYSHEVISHGFWPGGGAILEPSFYAYAAPEPQGLKTARVQPAAARYSTELSEFILPYEAVRVAPSPERELSAFLESTYDQASRLANWDRRSLER